MFKHSRYISPKVSQVPSYVLFALFVTWKLDLLTTETANDFKKFKLFILRSVWKHNFKVVG